MSSGSALFSLYKNFNSRKDLKEDSLIHKNKKKKNTHTQSKRVLCTELSLVLRGLNLSRYSIDPLQHY